MDPSRDFAFVIMNASDQIGGIQISSEGRPHVLGFEKSAGSSNLPLKILNKNGEDCSTEYKVVECYFEVDGEKVVPVESARVQEELARSEKQKEVSGCSGSEKETSHLNGMQEKLEIKSQKVQQTTESQRICSESRTIGAGTLDSVKPDCSSEQPGDLHQMSFNVGSSSYNDCSPVEKMRRVEVRVEDFRLLSAKKDGSGYDKNVTEEESSEMLLSEKLLFDLENEVLPRITRSQARNDDDALLRRSGRLQRDDDSEKKTNTNTRRLSTGKLTVVGTNHKHGQQRNSFPGVDKETKPQISHEATAKKKNLRKSQNLQSVQSQEVKEVPSRIHKSTTVQPNIVQKRPVGRPRKVVAKRTDDEAMVKDSEKNLQQKEESEVVTKKLLKQGETGLKSKNEDVSKTESEVVTKKLLKQGETGLKSKNEDVSKTDEGVKGLAEDQQRKEVEDQQRQEVEDQQRKGTEEKNSGAVKSFVEDSTKLDLPVVQNKHQESLVAVEMFCENVHAQAATANELLSKSQSSLSQKLHRGSQNSATVDWDEESQSSYDILLLRELSTDDSESKQVSDVDDPKEGAVLNTEQTPQAQIRELLAEIRQLMEQNFERFASNNIRKSFVNMTFFTEEERLRLESTGKAEQDKMAALQKELNARAQTLISAEAELLARKARLKDLQQAYDIEDVKNALEREQLAKARSEVAEELRKVAADHEKLRSRKYRGKSATPIKPLTTGKIPVKKPSVQFHRKRRSEEAKLESSTKAQAASFGYSSTTPEIDAQVTTEVHAASDTSPSSSVASVPETMASAPSSSVDESLTKASTTEIPPSSVSSVGTSEDPLGSCLPLKAVCITASSSEIPLYYPSTSVPSPMRDIPLSLSFLPDAETASNPPASSSIPLSSLSSSIVDASTVLPSNIETRPPLSSSCLHNEICLLSSASEVEKLLPSSSSIEQEILPPTLPSSTKLVRSAYSASVAETVQPVSLSSVAEILPPVSSFSLAETLTSVSSSSVVEVLPPVSSSSVTETLPTVSSSVPETLPSVSLPLKSESLSSTSASLPSRIETNSPVKVFNSSPSTPSSSKSTPCRSSTISCDNISPNCRHLFSNSVCMLPSVTLVPVTTPYVLPSHINHPCVTNLEKSFPSRLTRKRVAANGNSSSESKKIYRH